MQKKAIMPEVTDFGTNQKPTCDVLLVINTNLPPILHHFQVTGYGRLLVKFWLAIGACFTLMLSLGVIPSKYPDKLYLSRK